MSIVKQMLAKYNLQPHESNTDALREIMQEIALAGLARGDFFSKATFYGGTCLRIFYGLPRFSEDLDFSLLEEDKNFSFEPYFKRLSDEFNTLGFDVEITQRQKTVQTAVVSAFLKKNTSIYDVTVAGEKVLKIKFEVDTNPPLKFSTEEKLLLEPYSFYVKCFSLEDLFAGKMHALLFRQWKNRIKGRDWFDFEWYVRRGAVLNLEHFVERAKQGGHWVDATLNEQDFRLLLTQKIRVLDVENAKLDVLPFIEDAKVLDIWSQEYFFQLADKVKIKI